ncbi:hypothetical protein AC578_9703 [Pseudocercospora eumusae]|uniref:Uncharacterized protein n=1 Tax=Pseudocercospora eumusae TaxID=321146 RepID=A0A139HQP2_9PEZI|nr:hypothetical protein AC578_9703 [Pseudocercospora eumusae]
MQLFNNSAIKIELFPKKNKKNKQQDQAENRKPQTTVTCTPPKPRSRGRPSTSSRSAERQRSGSRNARPSLDYRRQIKEQASYDSLSSQRGRSSRENNNLKIAQQYSTVPEAHNEEPYHAISEPAGAPSRESSHQTATETGSLHTGQQTTRTQQASQQVKSSNGNTTTRPDSGPDPNGSRWVELPPNSPLISKPPESPLIGTRKAWGVEQLAPNSMSRLGTHAQRSPNTKTKISENMAKALASKKSRERLRMEQAQAAMAKKQSHGDLRAQHQTNGNTDRAASPSPPPMSPVSSDSDGYKPQAARPVQDKKPKENGQSGDRRTAKVPGTVNSTTAESLIAKRRSVADLNSTEKTTKAKKPVYADSEAQTSPDLKRHSRPLDPSQAPRIDRNSISKMPRMAPEHEYRTDKTSKRRSRSESSLRAQPRSRSKPRSRSQNRPKPSQINVPSARSQRDDPYRNQTGVSPMDWASKAAADRKRQWNYNYNYNPSFNETKSTSVYTNGAIPSVDAHVQQSTPGWRDSFGYSSPEDDGDYGSATMYGSHRISYGSPNPATIFGNALYNASAGMSAAYSARAAGRV